MQGAVAPLIVGPRDDDGAIIVAGHRDWLGDRHVQGTLSAP
ncbi:50S ribosomal L6 domain protein [Mycobacterium kansasii 662]|uniref:50S ribosomal L6 domain protein n=1 Tax=Mycobacterium kansasii 662 TaxID=1299326 RepID=X7YYM1_MYCKA|nr:50S ribosomal L6 domain protein [Mycobacterium kansasii 662]